MTTALLERIHRPADLKALTVAQLSLLAQEIREELVQTIAGLGGHLASSLGAVELCLAVHDVFEAPDDQLVWDMGYQAFAHKLITGRRDRFQTLKQFGGLSGFNHKDESPYDLFTTGHGGTALSTALGLALARDQVKGSRHVVAIIGDASLGEGMALEALNHIGHLKSNILVILNDNKMSIAKPVGGLSRYLNRIITNPTYNRIRRDIEQLMERLPHGSQLVRLGRKVEESLKGLLIPGLVFEELGFRYVGPIDGHNFRELITTLNNVKRLNGPILLHVSTVKGKGYRFAEADPERFHKIDPFDIATGQLKVQGSKLKAKPRTSNLEPSATFTEAFSDELLHLGEGNKRVVVITAAMPEGTGVSAFAKRYPARCLDVGMAEQHAVGLAAGLARGGARPIVAIYSTFLQRAYDQIMHEVCLQELPVILAIDRASLVGEDGPTHHGVFDIAYLRVFPRLIIGSPKDPAELRAMLQWAIEQEHPVALRYPRGGIICGEPLGKSAKIVAGKSETLRSGKDLALLALGSMVYPALKVAEELAREGVDAHVVNARFVKPLDEEMVKHAARLGAVVTLEEAQLAGGFGSAVSETLSALELPGIPHLRIGLPDQFVEHGKREELLTLCRLDPDSLTKRITAWHHALNLPTAFRLLAESSA
ncbi:MAG: 1-deoxy-D-xylulose-5-phosphate synthase [Candidatus Omnitrophica bacterium]|nr:1-deoxy-D-xylulose-5-phosphate synthase [Candidatus Omnitrophota bacterium]